MNSIVLIILLFTIISYLFGSLSSAIIVCKLMGLPDPRTIGSKNPGATNVLREGGRFPAALTLIGDILKGVIPVLIAKWYGLNTLGLGLVTLAAFLGHLYPIFFGFEGGKGVATLIGCIFALSWQVGLAFGASWLVMALIFRYSSLASLTATLLSPFFMWYFTADIYLSITLGVIAVIIFWRHRKNIQNLIQGKENKIGRRKGL